MSIALNLFNVGIKTENSDCVRTCTSDWLFILFNKCNVDMKGFMLNPLFLENLLLHGLGNWSFIKLLRNIANT